jgi:hypothetical protein
MMDCSDFKVEDSQNLVDFIEWAKEVAPADEYIIIFCGHGNAWHPAFDGDTRGVIRDGTTNQYLGLQAIVDAFETTNTHFNMTMFISCLMGNIEYIAEIAPYTDYYFASSHVTSVSGNELYLLVKELANMSVYDNDSVVSAVASYLKYDYENFWNRWPMGADHTLTKCSNIGDLLAAYKVFTDRLVEIYDDNREVVDTAMGSSYDFLTKAFTVDEIGKLEWYRMSYTYDMVDIATNVADAVGDEQLLVAAAAVEDAAKRSIILQQSCNIEDVERVYYAIDLVNADSWENLGFGDGGYCSTKFDQATGWSRILKINGVTHCSEM